MKHEHICFFFKWYFIFTDKLLSKSNYAQVIFFYYQYAGK